MLNFLATLLLAVIGYKFFKSLINTDVNRERMEEAVKRHRMRSQNRQDKQAGSSAEDMTQCSVCEAYMPKTSATNCGREDCPN